LTRCVDVAVFAFYKIFRSRGGSDGVGTDARGDAFLSGLLNIPADDAHVYSQISTAIHKNQRARSSMNLIFCPVSETFSADHSRDLSQKLFKA
jgi:hypothetical protein